MKMTQVYQSALPKTHFCTMFFLVASEEEDPRDMRAGGPGGEMAFLALKILGQMTLLTLQRKIQEEGTMEFGGEVVVLLEVRTCFHAEMQGQGSKDTSWANSFMNAVSLLTPVPCISYCSGGRKGLLPTPDELPRFEGGRKPESWDGNREPGKKFGEVID